MPKVGEITYGRRLFNKDNNVMDQVNNIVELLTKKKLDSSYFH